jgi:hypothetical protein
VSETAGDATESEDGRATESRDRGHPGRAEALEPDERELLAAFERLSPQGSLRWGFDDALRRVDEPNLASAAGAAPWPGLPADLWERGRSAKIGQRFVGDVASVLADLLAADARTAADAAVTSVNGDRFVATWDALRYLAARIEALEARADPLGSPRAALDLPVPDLTEWAGIVSSWCEPVGERGAIVVGELCDGSVLDALAQTGRPLRGVDPRGETVWRAFGSPREGPSKPDLVLDEVAAHLASLADGSVAAVVLAGCVDRLDLSGKVALLDEAVRVVDPGGSVVVLTSDQAAFDHALPPTALDLLPGRPFHPETWSLLLERAGASETEWHRPEHGSVHAVVARFGP